MHFYTCKGCKDEFISVYSEAKAQCPFCGARHPIEILNRLPVAGGN